MRLVVNMQDWIHVMSRHIGPQMQMHHIQVHTPRKMTHAQMTLTLLHNQPLLPLMQGHPPN